MVSRSDILKILAQAFQGEILRKIFSKTVAEYKEPQRKGISKGKDVGFSHAKILSAFLSTIGSQPVQIWLFLFPSPFRVSYSAILHWFSDQKFKDKIAEFQQEICREFINKIKELSNTEETISFWGSGGEYPKILSHFGTPSEYGPHLVSHIFRKSIEELKRERTLRLLRAMINVWKGFINLLSMPGILFGDLIGELETLTPTQQDTAKSLLYCLKNLEKALPQFQKTRQSSVQQVVKKIEEKLHILENLWKEYTLITTSKLLDSPELILNIPEIQRKQLAHDLVEISADISEKSNLSPMYCDFWTNNEWLVPEPKIIGALDNLIEDFPTVPFVKRGRPKKL